MKIDPRTISGDAAYHWQASSIVPRPIAWVSTLNDDGSANLAPFSYFTGASADPPTCLIVVSRRRGEVKDTARNIERTREFVIHVVNEDLAERMNTTAGDHPYGVDEFDKAGLTKVAADLVAPPRIAESPVAMECRLERVVEVGADPVAIVIGEILLWHVDDALLDERGRLDSKRLRAVARMGGSDYARTRDTFAMVRPKVAR